MGVSHGEQRDEQEGRAGRDVDSEMSEEVIGRRIGSAMGGVGQARG
jgi:hypothetical protein